MKFDFLSLDTELSPQVRMGYVSTPFGVKVGTKIVSVHAIGPTDMDRAKGVRFTSKQAMMKAAADAAAIVWDGAIQHGIIDENGNEGQG
jgi:hypothetical protein